MKKLFQIKSFKRWFIISLTIVILVSIINILSFGPLNVLVSQYLGGSRKIAGGNEYYIKDFETKEEAKYAGLKLSQEICEEGFVLLKNDNNCLPLLNNEIKISVFGKNSVNLVYGGTGSGAVSSKDAKTIFESLKDAGFKYNEDLKLFYENNNQSGLGREKIKIEDAVPFGFSTAETPISSYSNSLISTFDEYNDAALVVISRIGGEGNDMPTTMRKSATDFEKVFGAASENDHYLELDQNEQDMLQMVCEHFDKVVLIVNSSTPIELGFLVDSNAYNDDLSLNHYDYKSHIDSCVWIGGPGEAGIMALGRLLKGEVNFSGRTVDTWAKDFTKTTSYNNISWGGENKADSYYSKETGKMIPSSFYFIDYEENIYIGYRYYETAYQEHLNGNYPSFDYSKEVVYPFGYGLSYTTFDWETVKTSIPAGGKIEKDLEISISVEVTNTGSVIGRDVVEIYAEAPYTSGGIEKSSSVLVGFAKTDEIKPGKKETVTISFTPYDFASYDYNDKNNNSFKGYELDAGSYKFKIMKNSHDLVDAIEYHIDTEIKFEKDSTTNYDVINRYDDASAQLQTLLSRSNFIDTWPQRRSVLEKTVDQKFVDEVNKKDSKNPLTSSSPEVLNSNLTVAKKRSFEGLKIYDLIGLEYTDSKWDELIAQITKSSMMDLANKAAFRTEPIDYIGKVETLETDGPVGFVNFMSTSTFFGTCSYPSECVLGSTWNTDLLYRMGENVGNEGLIGDYTSPYSGWYAPGVNIHRSPFGGRNYEYFSEDPFLTGKLASSEILGAKSKGVYCYIKHFALNEQETNREGVCVWSTEQAMREIYLKPFEFAVKEGKTTAVMSSFNRIGSVWAGGDYRLLTEILRNEWGFKGSVLSDFATQRFMDSKQMMYAGGNLLLNNTGYDDWYDSSNPLDTYVLKKCTKDTLYTIANSNAMNGFGGDGSEPIILPPLWNIWYYIIDSIIFASVVISGVLIIVLNKKKV